MKINRFIILFLIFLFCFSFVFSASADWAEDSVYEQILDDLGVIGDDVAYIKSYCTQIVNLLTTWNTQYLSKLVTIDSNVQTLVDFFVNEEHSDLEDSATDSVVTATSIYSSTPNGSSTSQNLGALGGFSTSISGNLDTGVSANSLFNIFSNGSDGDGGSIFGFFSSQAMFDMDPSLNRKGRGNGIEIVTDYYSHNAAVFDSFLEDDK